jgi:hypothetical protein
MADRPRFLVTLESAPSDVAVEVRLRLLLKSMLRSYGFRAVDVRRLPATQASTKNAPEAGQHPGA